LSAPNYSPSGPTYSSRSRLRRSVPSRPYPPSYSPLPANSSFPANPPISPSRPRPFCPAPRRRPIGATMMKAPDFAGDRGTCFLAGPFVCSRKLLEHSVTARSFLPCVCSARQGLPHQFRRPPRPAQVPEHPGNLDLLSSPHLCSFKIQIFFSFSQLDADFPLIPARCREPEGPSGPDRAGRPVPCTDSSPPHNQIPFLLSLKQMCSV
jgi:hypothetical protein